MSLWDAIVIGAGPAGIGGASLLAENGAKVLVIDEASGPGGQIWRGIEDIPEDRARLLGADYLAGRDEAQRLRSSGAELAFATQAWRVEPDGTVWLKNSRGIRQERGRRLLIATGAMERPVPLIGWTLPGVTTIGGMQILLKREGILPEGPLVLIGTGPLFYLYAAQCAAAGMRDFALIDTAATSAMMSAVRHLPLALTGQGPSYLIKGLKLLWMLRRAGIRSYDRPQDLRISSSTKGLEVHFRQRDVEHCLSASHVGLHEGVIPETHLPRSIGCRMGWSGAAAAFHPYRDSHLQSSISGVYIAGDAGGIGGATVALLEGRIAAMQILKSLGWPVDELLLRASLRVRQAHLAARPLINRLYLPPQAMLTPSDDVIACRCEEVTCGQIRAVLSAGCAGPNQAKAFLRCGMGPCQGRMCGMTLTGLTSATHRISMEQAGYLTIRPPLRPVSLGEIADIVEP
ncbi:FAD/NAD(P)-binding oxidoreductase [Ensifer sp. Root31]|uniref:FAD/NAD(P)-dependent oxidoreductase n=1 Tax=Ensifer sp. Root31 TaxID=1736512 RepID=UPI00070A79BB|nr:FAD/NAD(P)-binding oxidoreductase [Ensifer sp. Root31]KQU74658.1 FAD/NAD(P)-binding oxidoreductase [Ensifer sp. Root31]